ncbi:hypothetical protein [Mesorhizobium onobrychidis]|uniref:ATP-binding protein n=1 Tax=Mesorhizobium onobrychidis TaxID=2775404 RepID=A0ABY5QWG9_9HYPH|nr:hypothetical protein [Mesorhizobium onobrychidis]UVC15550.1 hypothetical protein IHQ72_34940 [Mesorhizobium onobrychidis]
MNQVPPELADSFDTLRKLWFSQFPKRANGGWWALSGFSIQATVALERFVRAFLINGEVPAVEIESLSDFLVCGDKLSLTQVKRTLTAKTLAVALKEAYEIISLCSPAMVDRIEFQIVCEGCDPGLTVQGLGADSIFGTGERYDKDRLALVRRLFVKGEPIRIMSNPGLSLRRTLLMGGVLEADRVARGALGDIFDAFDGRDPDRVRTALHKVMCDILAASKSEHRVPGRLLTAHEFLPRPNAINALFTRPRPRLDDLVGGRFRVRPQQLANIVAAAHAWLGALCEAYGADDHRLPVFWIDGRSGDGKSILLLQLVEALVTSGRLASVTELLGLAEFEAWLASCVRWSSGTQQAEISFLDDLPAEIDLFALDKVVDDGFYRGTPYVGLITCGTDDLYRIFSTSERLALTRFSLPAPDAAEYDAFHLWAEVRLGRPLVDPAVNQPSLAAFMLALTIEEQPETNSQISARSEAFARVRSVAAANALGFAAPAELVTPADVAKFAQYWTDVELSAQEQEDGLRLAHAEVIWPIYIRGINRTDVGGEWGRDLARVLAAQLRAARKNAARGLLGALLNNRMIVAMLGKAGQADTTADIFNAAYEEVTRLCTHTQAAPLFRLWLAANASKRLTAVTTAELRAQGRALLSAPGVAAQDRAEIAVSLLEGKTADAASLSAAAFLRGAQPEPIILRFVSKELGRGVKSLHGALVLEWLRRHLSSRAVGEVLASSLASTATPKLVEYAYAFIERFVTDPVSGPVLWSLSRIPRGRGFDRLQDRWLSTAADPATAARIYNAELGSGQRRRFVERAKAFMMQHPGIRGEHEVLARLLHLKGDDPVITGLAHRFLDQHAGSSLANPLLAELLRFEPLAATDLGRVLHHIDLEVVGAGHLFAMVAIILQGYDAATRRVLRLELSPAEAMIFDKAMRWKIPRALSPPLAGLAARADRKPGASTS